METIFMNTKTVKMNEPRKFAFNLSQRFALTGSNKHIAGQNLPISFTWNNIRQQYKNNKL